MSYTVNMIVDDVHETTRRAAREFAVAPRAVFGFVEAGADILRATDPYQDQTGDLRASTEAINVVDDPGQWHFQLRMGEHYASYVNNLGFSRIEEVAGAGGVVRGHIVRYLTVTMPRKILGV